MTEKNNRRSWILIMFLITIVAVGCGTKDNGTIHDGDGNLKGKSATESIYLVNADTCIQSIDL